MIRGWQDERVAVCCGAGVLSIAQLLLPAGRVDLELQASLLADIPLALLYPDGCVSESAKGTGFSPMQAVQGLTEVLVKSMHA